ncbi:hypothetical protein RintRC_5668 [Richelia intracellularis]|nr:hypothetical protein RintRC_5668 [Richelia intracellularis]
MYSKAVEVECGTAHKANIFFTLYPPVKSSLPNISPAN